MLQEDAWHITPTAQYKGIYMATGQRPRWTTGVHTVTCQASQAVIDQPCLPPRYAVKNHTARE